MGGVRELRPAARRIAPKCAPNCAACLNLLLLMLLGGELRLHLRLHLRLELRAHEGVDLRLHLGLLQQRRVRVAARTRRAGRQHVGAPDPGQQQRLPPTPGSCGCTAAAASAPPIAPAPGGGRRRRRGDVHRRRRGGAAGEEGSCRRPSAARGTPLARGCIGAVAVGSPRPARSAAPRLRREGQRRRRRRRAPCGSPSGTPPSAVGGVPGRPAR